MAQGFVSDVPDDDTVMETPTVTVSFDLSQLTPQQALAVMQESTIDQNSYDVGELVKGNDVTDELQDAEFHLPFDSAIAALSTIGVITTDQPEEIDVEEQA